MGVQNRIFFDLLGLRVMHMRIISNEMLEQGLLSISSGIFTYRAKYRNSHIRKKAYDLIAFMGIHDLPVSPYKIAEAFGFTVRRLSRLTRAEQKGMHVCDGVTVFNPRQNSYMIFINDTHSLRSNFTLAHELGHIFLGHFNIRSEVMDEGMMEAQANAFARYLLIPFPAMTMVHHYNGSARLEEYTERLSILFQVSETAIDYALVEYKLWREVFDKAKTKAPVETYLLRVFTVTSQGREIQYRFCS